MDLYTLHAPLGFLDGARSRSSHNAHLLLVCLGRSAMCKADPQIQVRDEELASRPSNHGASCKPGFVYYVAGEAHPSFPDCRCSGAARRGEAACRSFQVTADSQLGKAAKLLASRVTDLNQRDGKLITRRSPNVGPSSPSFDLDVDSSLSLISRVTIYEDFGSDDRTHPGQIIAKIKFIGLSLTRISQLSWLNHTETYCHGKSRFGDVSR